MSLSDRIAGLKTSRAIKAPADVATTENIVLSGAQTIDSIAIVAGDRVLVKDQTDATENGIYDVSNGAWSRARDFNSSKEIGEGLTVYIKRGTVSENTPYILNTADPITLGTTDIVFGFSTNSSAGSVAVVTAAQAATAAAQAAAEQALADALVAQTAAEAAAADAANSVLQFLGPWTTATTYVGGNLVLYQGKTYRCLINHTADADFAVDLAAVRWDIFAESDFDLNARLPILTTGTALAYAIALPDPPPAPFEGLAGVMKPHLESGFDPTLDLGFGPWPIQIRDETDTLNNVTPGLLGQYETFSFVVRAGFVVEITSQPVREIIAGPALLPLASQTGDFDGLIEGAGGYEIKGNWVNGPLAAGASADYDAVNCIVSVGRRGDSFFIQTAYLIQGGQVVEYRRNGIGSTPVWSNWRINSGDFVWSSERPVAGETEVDFLGISEFATEVAVAFFNVDTSNDFGIRMGAGGIVDSGYDAESSWFFGNATSGVSATDQFAINSNGTVTTGEFNFKKVGSNKWIGSGNTSREPGGHVSSTGFVTLPGPLDTMRIFDEVAMTSGTVSIGVK